ncbi:GNAT family N-acetyltransferase [Tsukamurella sputi]|uniref:GNAT family N-acetyltransferase n=1 Tax=Tsukamurella sputi TaxID=2591848 RepID=A0A5C5RRM3_9ACTN|nr:GNAT family N-acetyltransferase [Tsukamurella sputi]TWS25178.1 GNAT family N-acetyltransferase [Tsukamurella sputi]
MRRASGDELDASTLYALLKLRAEVFIAEQQSPWLDVDGRDLDPSTVHLWLAGDAGDGAVATVRVTDEGDGLARIGRVCAAPSHRGQGLIGALMTAALAELHGRACLLEAQSHLEAMYAKYGFAREGDEFIEDGIPHVPMRRTAGV